MTCWRRGLYKHAITHDLSKFHPKEFFAYAKYFYISEENYKDEFKIAKEHHYRKNPHHWQYWLDKNGEPLEMSQEAIEQMIADWEGMGLEFGDTAQEYYLKNRERIKLDDTTRKCLEDRLYKAIY
jgi:hypothetical protein